MHPETTNSENLLSPEARETYIQLLAEHDAQEFISAQKHSAQSIVKDIKSHSQEFKEQAQKAVVAEYKKNHSNTTLTLEQIDEMSQRFEELEDTYRKTYASRLCQIGNGSYNYCIGLQRHAINQANKKIGYPICPDIGTSCQSAKNKFTKQKIGNFYTRISDCFDENTKQTKLNQDGSPILNDGDLMLVINPYDNQAYHCLRINVNDKKEVTYTAGNGEALNGGLAWWCDDACYIIPTSKIVEQKAKEHYKAMSDELLKQNIQTKNITTPEKNIANRQALKDQMLKDHAQMNQVCQRLSTLERPNNNQNQINTFSYLSNQSRSR